MISKNDPVQYFKSTQKDPEIGVDFEEFWWFSPWFSPFANDVLCALTDKAKDSIYDAYKVDADFAHIRNCEVKFGGNYVRVLENTLYSLYKLNESSIPEIILFDWMKFRKPKKPSYATSVWINKNWFWCWLLISEPDIERFKKQLRKKLFSLTALKK